MEEKNDRCKNILSHTHTCTQTKYKEHTHTPVEHVIIKPYYTVNDGEDPPQY
jgi:hypothetical protein